MINRLILLTVAGLYCSAWLSGQVDPSAYGGAGPVDDDSLMAMPPQVSGKFFASSVGAEQRSNVLSVGILFTAGYDDNVLTGDAARPVSAETFLIVPNIQYQETTSRFYGSLLYTPGFTFYHPISALNQVNQNATGDFEYRLSPRATIAVQDIFQQNSTVFSAPYTFSGAALSGAIDAPSTYLILPFAGQVADSTQARIAYQVSRDAMVGGSGTFSLVNYSAASAQTGVFDSDGGGGSAFYARRFGKNQYLGLDYGYTRTVTSPINTTSQVQSGMLFYAIALPNRLTLSISGGPDYSTSTLAGAPTTTSWGPGGGASLGWQKNRTNLVMSYSRSITSGQGFLGVYTADGASLLAQWQLNRKLIAGINGTYANVSNGSRFIPGAALTGHTLLGRASIQYMLGEHTNIVGEYIRLHQNYSGITAISNNPDSDRVAISINYLFTRPLGR